MGLSREWPRPGVLQIDIDRHSHQLRTNVPDVAMCYSDSPFAYGPFVPHHVPRQYVENYFATHGTDPFLVLNTTVEDVSRLPPAPHSAGWNRWRLTLRQSDPVGHVDRWWQEDFDALIMANGHYSVPYVRGHSSPPLLAPCFSRG